MQKQDGKVMSENEFEDELEKMYWDFDVERAKGSKCERLNFKMFMRIASGLRVERKQDNSWHERGELPPVGCECETINNGAWIKVEVLRHRVNDVGMNVAAVMSCTSFGVFWATGFRPLRTERDKVVEDMVKIMTETQRANLEINASALYAAGYRKTTAQGS